MSGPRVTPKRVRALKAISEGDARWSQARGAKPVTANGIHLDPDPVRWALRERLVVFGAFDGLVLTDEGTEVLRDATDQEEYDSLPWEQIRSVRASVQRRRRGMHPIRGMGRVPDGRDVICYSCRKVAVQQGKSDLTAVVWYTNEGGVAAQKDAELVLRRHVLAHLRGELPMPAETSGEQP